MFNLFGFMLMPIVIPVSSGGGSADPNALTACLIVVNVICIFIFLARSVIWYFEYKLKEKEREKNYRCTPSYLNYSIFGEPLEMTYIIATLNFMCFSIVNGLAIFIWMIIIVMKFMGE